MSEEGHEFAVPVATPKGLLRKDGKPLRFPKIRKCLTPDCLTVTRNLGGLCGECLNGMKRG